MGGSRRGRAPLSGEEECRGVALVMVPRRGPDRRLVGRSEGQGANRIGSGRGSGGGGGKGAGSAHQRVVISSFPPSAGARRGAHRSSECRHRDPQRRLRFPAYLLKSMSSCLGCLGSRIAPTPGLSALFYASESAKRGVPTEGNASAHTCMLPHITARHRIAPPRR